MRLFWRILSGYFLAWALLCLALFGALAIDSWTHILPRSAISQSFPASMGVQLASVNLQVGGETVFRLLADGWQRGEPPFAIDTAGREILGRAVDPAALELARSLAVESTEPASVKRVASPEGVSYVVFYPEGLGPGDRSVLHWILEWPWLLGIALALAGLLLAGGLTAAWTRPIAGLKSAFDALTDGAVDIQLDPRITARHDELGDLGRHFEHMAQRLSRSIGTQRQLLHDVSHEIRSPLARLSVATDLARRRPERMDEALQRIDRESERLDRLIGEVLTLARLESDVSPSLDDYLDLVELLRVIRDDVAFEAHAVGIEVHLENREDELVMQGNAELLRRAIENVVRNALQHAEGSSRIDILLDVVPHDDTTSEAPRIQLRIRDQGEGMDDAALASLFEPFSKGSGSGGFGLGLAIARRAVTVHKGTIRAQRSPEGGVEVGIDLPLIRPAPSMDAGLGLRS